MMMLISVIQREISFYFDVNKDYEDARLNKRIIDLSLS